MNENVSLMEENVIQINGWITINVDVSVKDITYVKKNPATCICKNGKYLASIIDDSVIKCDEIIDADAEAKSCNQRIKTISKNIIFEKKVSTFCLAFS